MENPTPQLELNLRLPRRWILYCDYCGEGFVPEIVGSYDVCLERQRKQTMNGTLKFKTKIIPYNPR